MKKRRVVIDASPLLYKRTGIGRLTASLIARLADTAHDFEIVLFGRRLQGHKLSSFAHPLPLPCVHIRLPRAAEWIIGKAGLAEVLCRGDLYHATDFYMPLRKSTPAVTTVHDIIFLTDPENMIDHERLAKKAPHFIAQCRRIITISEFSKKEISETLHVSPEIIDVVYPGVERSVFSPPADATAARIRVSQELGFNRPYFLAVSCSTGRKNTPLLLEAYSQLLRQQPQNDLVLLWTPPQEIADKYRSSEMGKRIHFIGWQDDSLLRDIYGSATAVVFPSLYEGFGLPVVEAMSCGVPVITSELTSIPEAGGKAAIYIDPRDISSIVKAMEDFENGNFDCEALRKSGIEQAAKFSWESCAEQTIAVYSKGLDNL